MNDKIIWKFPNAIVNCEWLAEKINNDNISISVIINLVSVIIISVIIYY